MSNKSHYCSFHPIPSHRIPHHVKHQRYENVAILDELLEGAVDGRADFGAFVEIDGGYGTLADAFGGEFKFLVIWLAYWGLSRGNRGLLPCRRLCMHRWHRIGSDRIARASIAPSPLLT